MPAAKKDGQLLYVIKYDNCLFLCKNKNQHTSACKGKQKVYQ